MTSFRRGDVVVVPITFTDGSGEKRRPAVVISSDDYNAGSPDILVVSVTSNLKAVSHPGDHEVVDWSGAGLLRPSLVQTKIATIAADSVRQVLGRLQSDDLAQLDAGLRQALALM